MSEEKKMCWVHNEFVNGQKIFLDDVIYMFSGVTPSNSPFIQSTGGRFVCGCGFALDYRFYRCDNCDGEFYYGQTDEWKCGQCDEECDYSAEMSDRCNKCGRDYEGYEDFSGCRCHLYLRHYRAPPSMESESSN
jgi:hypothetical protein